MGGVVDSDGCDCSERENHLRHVLAVDGPRRRAGPSRAVVARHDRGRHREQDEGRNIRLQRLGNFVVRLRYRNVKLNY